MEKLEKTVLSRRKMINGLLLSLIIGITAFLLVFFITIDRNTIKSLQHIDTEFLLLATIAIFLSVLMEALRIQVIAQAIGENIGFWISVKIFYITFFLGGITPYFSGAIPGQIFLFNKQGISVGKGTLIATIRSIIKSIIFLVIAPLFFFYFRPFFEEYELLSWFLIIIAIVFSVIVISVFILVARNPQNIELLLRRIEKISFLNNFLTNPDVQHRWEAIIAQIRLFQQSYHLLLRHPKKIFIAFLCTFLYWLFYFSVAPLLLLALEIQLDFFLVMAIQVLIFFLLPYLPTPGGSGAAELGFVSLFSFFVPAHLLGIYVGGWRLVTFYLNIIIGALLSLGILKDWVLKK